ncbi:MAG: tetratricopeptide repeat protein, partial [Candidatus Omnitrophica bacterium]|nr:tetratricopeptide repeat protein [Candidatus Omnitrophota bacterium]
MVFFLYMHIIPKLPLTFIMLIFLSSCVIFPVHAAVVLLQNGEKINGIITNKTQNELEISVAGIPRVYQMQDVKEIRGRQVLQPKLGKVDIERLVASSFGKALSRAAEGEFEEAAQMFERIAKDHPSYVSAQEALNMCNEAISGKVSRQYALYVFEAKQQMFKENYPLAIVLFQKALTMNPKATSLYYDLGCVYQLLGENQKAVSYFKKISQIEPDNPDVLFKLGVSLHALRKYKEALGYFEKLEKL